MDSNWMGTLASAIACLRLGLICCGIWMLLKYTRKRNTPLDYQSKCFAIATIVYLVGLMPQSIFLLFGDSEIVNSILDTGCLCWAQKFAFLTAVALHNVLFLNWMVEYIVLHQADIKNWLAILLKHTCFHVFLVSYVVVFIVGRSFFLRRDDGQRFFTDIVTKSEDEFVERWTASLVKRPSQVIRLQLLLCESSLAQNEIFIYLVMSYAFVGLPLLLMIFVLKTRYRRMPVSPVGAEVETVEAGQVQSLWFEREENVQGLLSASISIWFHFIQPIIFATNPEHFIDFGSHLMLTVCVFLPWVFPLKNYNSLQNWV